MDKVFKSVELYTKSKLSSEFGMNKAEQLLDSIPFTSYLNSFVERRRKWQRSETEMTGWTWTPTHNYSRKAVCPQRKPTLLVPTATTHLINCTLIFSCIIACRIGTHVMNRDVFLDLDTLQIICKLLIGRFKFIANRSDDPH